MTRQDREPLKGHQGLPSHSLTFIMKSTWCYVLQPVFHVGEDRGGLVQNVMEATSFTVCVRKSKQFESRKSGTGGRTCIVAFDHWSRKSLDIFSAAQVVQSSRMDLPGCL